MPDIERPQFGGNVAEVYDSNLVPLIFEFYAARLAERIVESNPRRVLEIAAGTGAATRAIAAVLGPGSTILATDLSQPMLDRAAVRQGSDPRVTFQQADAMSLPFADRSFDAAVCQFGVMFFPDKIAAHRETRRVLEPGARYILDAWDRIEDNTLALACSEALAGLFPDDPPDFMRRIPHAYFDPKTITHDLEAAGFSGVSVTRVASICRAASASQAALAYCQGTPMRGEIETRRPGHLDDVTGVVSAALERRFGTGMIEAPMSALIAEAVA
ncbi:methyltransferase domain-containing protein [Kaistia geumhonensis]|uniref:Ubiquinone/menaquinone biosynthesis C-methylase UbiE n=1 Tax=Kaistia geumhonensis TaxID=410839 RepID=A0ABU0M287_9HYPH|nr:methyltransferase domain-containing protein [Kaistia geumhonensis]MCX5479713.1 methyltransferase domain-containing protein [Kaistia geumhonensis]MDQ0515063.1 ubiquinone/menaquinone biosynthesis C-methylase UbiE [Kaistia geumhonensis]